MCNAPEGMTNVDAGQLKILGNFGSKRFEKYPDVPTAQESGLDLTIEQWRGVVVPKGTPPELIAKLHDIIKECVEDERYVEKMKSMDAVPAYKNTADFKAFMESENKRFEELTSPGPRRPLQGQLTDKSGCCRRSNDVAAVRTIWSPFYAACHRGLIGELL